MNDKYDITIQELLDYVKSKDKNGKPNHVVHQINWWLGEYVKEKIPR